MGLLQYSQPMGAPPGPTTPPILSPPGGAFAGSFPVVITAAPGALIFFTTDGSTPTFPISGTTQLYTGPITVSVSETIRAIAIAPAFVQSLVSTGVYSITQAATPTFAPGTGTYTTVQLVTISCTTPGSSIYYTTDGSIPTTGSTLYSGPVTVQASETLNAIAVAPGFSQSAVGSATYTINFVIVDISPSYGVVGIVNNGSVVPSGGLDNQSNAYSETLIGSAVNWAGFTFNIGPPGVVDAVSSATITLPAGNFLALDMLALGCHGNQVAQVFTVTYTDLTTTTFTQSVSDWFTPQNYAGESQALQMAYRIQPGGTTQNGPFYLYGYSFALNAAKVVKSLTLPNNRFVVALAVDLTTLSAMAATPTFLPVGGTYSGAQSVMISTTTPSATIYYTTDGSTPTTSSAVYTGPVSVLGSETLNAIATSPGFKQSAVGISSYVISGAAPQQYKWNPGYYIVTQAIESGDQFGAGVQAEIDKIASYVGLPITGYVCAIHARHLENWTLTTNLNDPTNITTQYPGFLSNLEPIANYFWSKFPSGHFALYINFTTMGQNITDVTTYNYADGFYIPHHIATCGGSLTVPNSYGSSQTTTYPLSPIYNGASYYGFGFAAFSGSAFGQVVPAFWNRAVNQRMMIQLFQALSMYKFQSGPFAGQTIDQIPQFEFVGTNDEYSYNMNGAQNLLTGPTVNTPGGSGQDAATNTNFFARRQDAYTKICAALPHTLWAGCESYGFDAIGNDTAPLLAGYVNNYISGNGLSTIRGYACSNADLFMTAWIPDPGNILWSTAIQQGFLGISNPSSTPPLPAPTATSLVGQNPFIAQFQNGDYEQHLPTGTLWRSQGAVLALIQAALGASPNGKIPTSHLCFCIADSTGGTSALDGYLHQALTTYVPQYPVAANLPISLMFAPLNLAASASSHTVTVSWTVASGVGPNMTYDILDSGSVVSSGNTASPVTLTNVTLGQHSYTIRMHNPNGFGPQSAPVITNTLLSWTVPTVGADGMPIVQGQITSYNIGIGTSSGNYTQFVSVADPTLASEALSQIVPPLTPGTTYYVAIQSVGGAGSSAYSNEISFTV